MIIFFAVEPPLGFDPLVSEELIEEGEWLPIAVLFFPPFLGVEPGAGGVVPFFTNGILWGVVVCAEID